MNTQMISDKLNVTLANAIVTYQKLHQYHWRVSGEQFFRLHEKFEELYDTFNQTLDDVAERILTIGGEPVGTLAGALELATISEDDTVPSANDMVSNTLYDLETQQSQIQGVIAAAEAEGDRGTVNLLDGISDDLEKQMWMLRAYLRQNAGEATATSREKAVA
ncbi:DNA starvation/stationary phase protection protein [candidate division GN15 bacterium]|nr:DNA starvation/stationary phase protection protein [candidate division GN15 bacterium]